MGMYQTPWVAAAASALLVVAACSGAKVEEAPKPAAVAQAPAVVVGSEVGARAPAFALPNGAGETVSLEDYAGKPVAVVFYRGQW